MIPQNHVTFFPLVWVRNSITKKFESHHLTSVCEKYATSNLRIKNFQKPRIWISMSRLRSIMHPCSVFSVFGDCFVNLNTTVEFKMRKTYLYMVSYQPLVLKPTTQQHRVTVAPWQGVQHYQRSFVRWRPQHFLFKALNQTPFRQRQLFQQELRFQDAVWQWDPCVLVGRNRTRAADIIQMAVSQWCRQRVGAQSRRLLQDKRWKKWATHCCESCCNLGRFQKICARLFLMRDIEVNSCMSMWRHRRWECINLLTTPAQSM